MSLLSLGLLLSFIVFSCGREEKTEENAEDQEQEVRTYAELPEIRPLEGIDESQIDSWINFRELEAEMRTFRNKNSGDLTYTVDQLIQIENKIHADTIPDKFNTRGIKSRLNLMKTFLYQLKFRLQDNDDVSEVNASRTKVMEAYNALRFQISEVLREKIYEDFLEKNRDSVAGG